MNPSLFYELRKPSNIEPDKTYPALFVTHGMGSDEQNMLPLVDGLEEQFYVFSLRGPLPQPPGFAFFTIQGFGKPNREAFDHVITRLSDFIDYATDKYPIDPNKIYLLGFSQGAIVSMTLGLVLGERIRGIVALSGYIPIFVKEEYPLKPVEKLSLFVSHGKSDNILPYEWGEESYSFFKELGAQVTFQDYLASHTVSLENLHDFRKWIQDDLSKS